MGGPCFLYPFICWCPYGLPPPTGNYGQWCQHCMKDNAMNMGVQISDALLWIVWGCQIMGWFYFNFLRNCRLFLHGCTQFHVLTNSAEDSNFSTSSWTVIISLVEKTGVENAFEKILQIWGKYCCKLKLLLEPQIPGYSNARAGKVCSLPTVLKAVKL